MSILSKLMGKDPQKSDERREKRKARQSAKRERTKEKRDLRKVKEGKPAVSEKNTSEKNNQ